LRQAIYWSIPEPSQVAMAAAVLVRHIRRPVARLSEIVGTSAFRPTEAVRRIRTGYFAEDADFIDPDGPLLAQRQGDRWRYMDDPTLASSVLERNNVGMGMLVLNRPKGLDLPLINDLYVRLRNLEVNSLKRFVGLTANDPGPFCMGLDPQELLLAATVAKRYGRLPKFSRALLWHHQELAHLVADFRKPLVCQMSGLSSNGGAALACLASFSGAHEDSEVAFDSCQAGVVPMGGATHVLAGLSWNLGEFLALTGRPVRGADLVYVGLLKHWIAPEALPFLELTAEKHLEVSETDSRGLLDEHSLPLPDGLGDYDSLPKKVIPVLQRAFSKESVPEILIALRQEGLVRDTIISSFVDDCIERMERASPLALHVTLQLIRRARAVLNDVRAVPPKRSREEALEENLRLELRAQQRLLCSEDAMIGLHARCLGREMAKGVWSRRGLTDVTADEVKDVLKSKPSHSVSGETEDFAVHERSEISLSSHPRLRQYHPEFDPSTGLDHDPAWMQSEVKRWSTELFAEERRRAIHELLGSADPALYGQARYTRSVAGG